MSGIAVKKNLVHNFRITKNNFIGFLFSNDKTNRYTG